MDDAPAAHCYWLHLVAAGSICPLACATMMPAMVVAMLWRRHEYTAHRPVLERVRLPRG